MRSLLVRRRPGILTAFGLTLLVGLSACAAFHLRRSATPIPGPRDPNAYAIPERDNPKLTDFRLNPPVVKSVSFQKHGGKTLFTAEFAEDKRLERQLTLRPDGHPIVLHDDGTNGDVRAGDRTFSAIVPIDIAALRKEQQRAIDALERAGGSPVLREFRGREVVRSERIDIARLRATLAGDIVKLVPFGTGSVDEKKTLMVTNVSVVEDPTRAFDPCTSTGAAMGKWTFGYLMQQMANQAATGINASDFTLLWLKHWLHPQAVNGFNIPARPSIQAIIDRWPKLSDGRLDLAKAPMRLLAIVNRIDLAENLVYGNGNAGEGRFVFGVMDTSGGGCSSMPFTVILEYGVPKHTCSDIKSWANDWVALDGLALGSVSYNLALESITEQFAHADADPSKPNGSAINQIRTDEIALDFGAGWELREFKIFSDDSDAGQLRMVTAKQTPDRETYNFGKPREADLAAWINANDAAIKMDRHTVPAVLPFPTLEPFLAGNSLNGIDFWNATGILDSDARFHFSLNTCNACHGRETATGFTHVNPASPGSEASLSGFLQGDGVGGDFIVSDPVTGTPHAFFDLARRAQVLNEFSTQDCLSLIRFRPIMMVH